MARRRFIDVVNDPHTEWTQRKLQVLLCVGVVVAVLLAAGVVWSVASFFDKPSSATQASPSGTGIPADVRPGQAQPGRSDKSGQDELANRPLPTAPPEAAQPGGGLSSNTTGTLQIPPPMKIGPAGVAAGFTHTPAGALAQLAAIDSAALSSVSVRGAQQVITAWAAPGGPTASSWSGVNAVAALLGSAGLSADGAGSITVTVDPKMGFIKGTVGPDFVVPCVDYIVTVTAAGGRPQQVAVADCQRMVWHDSPSGGRWVIGPGEEAVEAPSLWPGSQASFDAGYLWLEVPQQ